jgi:hypothetical protein
MVVTSVLGIVIILTLILLGLLFTGGIVALIIFLINKNKKQQ